MAKHQKADWSQKEKMTARLNVNIDHVATVRQARRGVYDRAISEVRALQ